MFLGVWCVCARLHMLMCAIVTGRATTNAVCSGACERQHLNLPLRTWCLWALYVHVKRSWHICRRNAHGIQCDPAAPRGAQRLREEADQAPGRAPLTGARPGSVCHCRSYEIISDSLLKFNQNPVPLRNYLQIGRLRMMNITITLISRCFHCLWHPAGSAQRWSRWTKLFALCAVTFDWCIIRRGPPCFWALLKFPFFCRSALMQGSPPTTQTYRGSTHRINLKTEREERLSAGKCVLLQWNGDREGNSSLSVYFKSWWSRDGH